jgi:hypothetical protein
MGTQAESQSRWRKQPWEAEHDGQASRQKVDAQVVDGSKRYRSNKRASALSRWTQSTAKPPMPPKMDARAVKQERQRLLNCWQIEVVTVTGSSRESTTGTQGRSTDISIHPSPARRGEPDSLGADSVAPTIRLHHSPKRQTFPTHITNRYRDLEVHDNLTRRT